MTALKSQTQFIPSFRESKTSYTRAKRNNSYLFPMVSVCNCGEIMPAPPIRKLVPFAEVAKKRGTKIYHLNIGQPDIETPQQMLDAVRKSDFNLIVAADGLIRPL